MIFTTILDASINNIKMKTKTLLVLMGMAMSLLVACHKPDEPIAEKPNWVAVVNPEFSTSMTMICVPPTGERATVNDELAAFMDNQCYGVASLQDGIFYLGIPGPEDECPLELRYYSATKQSTRTLVMTYMPNARLGSSDVPYSLSFHGQSPRRVVLRGTIAEDASAAAPHRVNIGEAAGEKLWLYWREDDRIRLQAADGTNSSEMVLTNGANSNKADFETWGTVDNNYHVTYPISATYAHGDVSFSIPSTQQYVADNYADNLMPMEGQVRNAAAGEFDIRPIGAVLCLKLTSTTGKQVKRIVMTVPNEVDQTAVSGNFLTAGIGGSDVTKLGSNGKTISLECAEDVALSSTPTAFHFVLPAVELLSGTEFCVTFADESDMTKTTRGNIELGQGCYTPLSAFSVD